VPNFEDLRVEKECRIRKRIAAVFNKREEDFETLRDYNDYLEEVERIVFNLVEDVDVQKTSAMLDAYRQQNLDQIARNKLLQEQEEAEQKRLQAEEAQQRLDYESQLLAELEAVEQEHQMRERNFIEELASSNQSAATLLSTRRTVGKDLKRKAQQAALQEMPSMKGLRSRPDSGQDANIPRLDPFDTVPKVILPFDCPDLTTFPGWFFGSRVPDMKQLAAGGVKSMDLARQVLLAACTH
jgi:CDK-activating kinase assembly factor MAT1